MNIQDDGFYSLFHFWRAFLSNRCSWCPLQRSPSLTRRCHQTPLDDTILSPDSLMVWDRDTFPMAIVCSNRMNWLKFYTSHVHYSTCMLDLLGVYLHGDALFTQFLYFQCLNYNPITHCMWNANFRPLEFSASPSAAMCPCPAGPDIWSSTCFRQSNLRS